MSPRALVVGAGLMGTSLGLALRAAGWPVWLTDEDERALRLAGDLGAGQVGVPDSDPELVFIAVPPSQVGLVASSLHQLYPNATLSDLGSVKANLQVEIESIESLSKVFVPGHPLAGRERSGAGAARADLFEGRPWVLTPGVSVGPDRQALVASAVVACGAVPVVMSAAEHDEAVALVSHAPQVVASVLAAQLRHGASRSLELSGQGIRDTVRIAASDPGLWAEILRENAAATATVLHGVIGDLEDVVEALETIAESVHRDNNESTISASGVVVDLLKRGNEGYARIPGKHGSPPATYAQVPVVIPDEPGALAALFLAAGRAGVNVEDVHIEHSAGQPVGLVELAVAPTAAAGLVEQLRAGGWSVH